MSTSGLYGNITGATQVPANDTTSLYGASSNAQVVNANGDLLVVGNLAVDGGNITTTASIATVFNTNATTVSAFGAATALSLGGTAGSTSINNNLITGGTINAAGNITAPGGIFGNITVGVATDNTIATTSGGLVLAPANTNINVPAGALITWPENSIRANRLEFKASSGTNTGVRVSPPVATGGLAISSINTTNDINNTQFLNISGSQAAVNPLRIQTGAYTAGVLGASGTSLAFIDGSSNTYATANPSGPTTGTDLTTKTYVDAQISGATTNKLVNGSYQLVLNADGTVSFPSYKFPYADGTFNIGTAAGQVLTTNGAGILSWSTVNNLVPTYTTAVSAATGGVDVKLNSVQNATITVAGTTTIKGGTNISVTNAGNIITINGSDLNTTYTYTAGAVAGGANLTLTGSDATVNTVKLTNAGHITAVQTSATAVTLGSDATDANTASTIVARDASGNFSAGTITASLSGNATSATTATTATTANKVANSLTAGTHLSGGPFDGSAAVTLSTDATNANTASTIVARDSSGNFSAGTITANLSGNATTATTATTATQVANALTAGTHLSGGPFDGSSAVTLTTDATTTATASVLVARDANANTFANATFAGFTSVAASGSLITLTAASTPEYLITGSGGQTIKLPNATTLPAGAIFSFNNNQSSGAITVNNNSNTLIASVPSGGYSTVVLLDNSTAAGSWDRHDQAPSNVSWSTNTLSYPGSYTSSTGNVTANSTTIGSSVGTVSTSSGNLTLNTANGSGSSGSIVVTAGANGNISVTPNGTGIVSMGVTQLADKSYVLGSLEATTNTGYTFMGPALNTITSNNGLDVASSFTTALGNSGQQQITQYYADTFAGTNTAPALIFNTANGNSVASGTVPFTGVTATAPTAALNTNVLGTVNFNGYATTNFTQYATKPQGGGFNANHAVQIQATAAETFADGTLTISGATITAVTRVSVALSSVSVTGTKGQISFTSTTPVVGNCIAVTGTNSGSSTGISAGNYFVIATNGTTTATLSATPGGSPITTTAGTTTGLTFTRQFITVTYSAQSNIPFGLNALVAVSNITNVTAGTYMVQGTSTTTSVNIGAPSSGTPSLPGTQSLSLATVTNAGAGYRIRAYPLATTMNSGNRVELMNHTAALATLRADTFTVAGGAYGNTSTARMTVDASKVTMALPVAFPVYTATAANAITGAVGWQISISNSPTVGGRMAFWDTTNARWSYISDNTAV